MLRATWAVAITGALLGCRAPRREPKVEEPKVEEPKVATPDAAAPTISLEAARIACLEAHYVLPKSIPYDDGRTKTTEQRIAAPDIEDVFALRYEAGRPIVPVTDPEHDPGRARIEAVFAATYGADAKAVSAQLVPVKFAGKTVSFHRKAAPALERVARRLEPLVPSTQRFFQTMGGTFASRPIAGTDRSSAHSWGIAIDLDPSACEYWRNDAKPVWKNRVPGAIVDAFEAEGFIWGGRWFHYDTMHFEYRPELFDPRCIR